MHVAPAITWCRPVSTNGILSVSLIRVCLFVFLAVCLCWAQAPRFNVTAPPRVPGPGEYDSSKNSLLKKSFNMVIVEEEERALVKKR
jgi:hypothetical protein